MMPAAAERITVVLTDHPITELTTLPPASSFLREAMPDENVISRIGIKRYTEKLIRYPETAENISVASV